jgi:thymidylate kinase
MFSLLDKHEIRYVVLHSYDGLPEDLPSDLDMAVHPQDSPLLADVFGGMDRAGYRAVQCLNYAPEGNYFVFCRVCEEAVHSVAVDFVQAHRRGGVHLASGEQLVSGRRRFRNFWVPAAEVEWSYLLAKKALKRNSLRSSQQRRLRELALELGSMGAQSVAAQVFGERDAKRVVDACLAGAPGEALESLGGRLRAVAVRRRPLDTLRQAWMEFRRRCKRWARPTGLFVAVLGPDGSGKSTLLDGLLAQMQRPFRGNRVFHWRPMLIPGGGGAANVATPHRQQPRPAGVSLARVLVHFADYWLGYWLRVRPALVRSNLVLFDRYADDASVDPARYRFPDSLRGVLSWMSRIAPRPDITLVLDAPPSVMLARKQEIEHAAAARLRAGYLERGLTGAGFLVLNAAQPAPELSARAAAALIDVLANRFTHRERQWLRAAGEPEQSGTITRSAGGSEALNRLLRYSGATSGGSTLRYLAAPSMSEPRLLVPLDAPQALAASIDTYMPYALRARAATALLRVAIRTGAASAAGDEIRLSDGYFRDVRELVGETTGEPDPVFALRFGTPGRRCNLTLKAMRRDGGELGYLKISITGESVARVRHEAAVLRVLGRDSALRPHIPNLLFAGEWGNGYLLFQSAGAGSPGSTRFGEPHREFLRKLAAASRVSRKAEELVEETAAEWDDSPAAALAPDWRSLARFSLEEASSRLANADVACGTVHGDFAPWNTRLAAGRLFVFDWEAAEWQSPCCWDSFHFEVQVLARLGRGDRLPSNSAVELAVREPAMRPLLALYLLHSAAGLARDGVEPSNRSLELRKKLLTRLLHSEGRG